MNRLSLHGPLLGRAPKGDPPEPPHTHTPSQTHTNGTTGTLLERDHVSFTFFTFSACISLFTLSFPLSLLFTFPPSLLLLFPPQLLSSIQSALIVLTHLGSGAGRRECVCACAGVCMWLAKTGGCEAGHFSSTAARRQQSGALATVHSEVSMVLCDHCTFEHSFFYTLMLCYWC